MARVALAGSAGSVELGELVGVAEWVESAEPEEWVELAGLEELAESVELVASVAVIGYRPCRRAAGVIGSTIPHTEAALPIEIAQLRTGSVAQLVATLFRTARRALANSSDGREAMLPIVEERE